ncbi:peroxidase family protein [Antarctobacter sp.]|uniref:peroxidase family protein n=1 Tax=Antarctobacter sp. TaxID=1872577 RepID=UPI002B265809|nr:peroxidase family protein [Antarctobacter sp.]
MTSALASVPHKGFRIDWAVWRRTFLQLTCLLVGAMMFYRGLLNLFGYPSDWISLFPGTPLLGAICRVPDYWERWMLGPIFMGGVFGIVLMWRELRIGWWIFTALNFLVGYWFIFILEDIWQHHVLPHIVFSAVFLPFYPGMKRSQWLGDKVNAVLGWIATRALLQLQRPWVARLIEAVPFLHRRLNALLINRIVTQARSRPHPFSTMSPYTSWSSLTDRTWAGRHLGVSDLDPATLPGWDGDSGLKPLFERPDGSQTMCPKSTCLFPAFAQYLTDGFLRTVAEKDFDGVEDPERRKRNTSNHEIDMCPLYGRTPAQTRALRDPDRRGYLRSQVIAGEEYPEFLFADGMMRAEFGDLDRPLGLPGLLEACDDPNPVISQGAQAMRDALFAVGGDRVNSVPQVSMMNTLFLREHNRLAREIGARHPAWDDSRVFETARNVVIVQFIKIVVEDYINHIAPFAVHLIADPSVCWNSPWNKSNWITTEFSLLYRWHALIPDAITWGGTAWPIGKTYFLNNLPLLQTGLKRGFEDMSAQGAARLGPRNTNDHLLDIEWDSTRQGRICELASYNAYRAYLGQAPAKRFHEISSDPVVAAQLERAYGNVDKVDFFVGIFCEDRVPGSPLPRTILSFVALDAFSQALTNPLLSQHVFQPPKGFDDNAELEHPTFSRYGWEQIQTCGSLRDVITRNVDAPETLAFIGMTRPDWRGA